LRKELEKEQFKEALNGWIEDIIKKELPKNSSGRKLKDIPAIEKSVSELISGIMEVTPRMLEDINVIIGEEKLSAVVSREQYNYIIAENTAKVF
jgi:hypothetical protein